MCGIVGYLGKRQATPVLLEGLRKLEYRGYDSAGIALQTATGIVTFRCRGKIRDLEAILPTPLPEATCGIGHTRWATHGRPSNENAHPHRVNNVVVVHNGIIENHLELRAELENAGSQFTSQTDTEIFAHLIDRAITRGALTLLAATQQALTEVSGSYAIAVMSGNFPNEIIAAAKGSPLVIGFTQDEYFLASDIPAFLPFTRDVYILEPGDIVRLTNKEHTIYNNQQLVTRTARHITWDPLRAEKGGFQHFMLKEIYEQPESISDTLAGRIELNTGRVLLGEDFLSDQQLRSFNQIQFIACGTSYHATKCAAYQYETILKLPTATEVGSEFRYRDPYVGPNTLVIAVSQSGETADTLAGVELSKQKGATVIAICNVLESSLARLSDYVVYTHAGPEISVASTKAFSSQLVALQLLLLQMATTRKNLTPAEVKEWLQNLSRVPNTLQQTLKLAPQIQKIARKYANAARMLYLGRHLHYPLALEGALKLKEISYIHAEGYPAGELKHGPIALIDHQVPIFALVHHSPVREKMIANIEEVKAREGKVIALIAEGDQELKQLVDHAIEIPSISYHVDPIILSIPLQLFAYYVAVERGTDVDQPRNLAKSVTVE